MGGWICWGELESHTEFEIFMQQTRVFVVCVWKKFGGFQFDELVLFRDYDYCPKASIESRLSEQQSKA